MDFLKEEVIRKFLKRRWPLVLLNVFLVAGYVLFMRLTGYGRPLASVMFMSPDSQMYRDVADWIVGINPKGWVPLIHWPFFYPVLLSFARFVAGLHGIWLMQGLMWLASANCVAMCVWRLTRSAVLSALGTIVFASNITVLLLTAHGLSEVTSVFLLSLYALVVVTNSHRLLSPRIAGTIVVLCAALGVVRAVFLPFALLVYAVIVACLILRRENLKASIRTLAWVTLALFPIFIQISQVKAHYGFWAISTSGKTTLYNYYFSKLYGKVNQLSVLEARPQVRRFSTQDIVRYCLQHRAMAVETYWENLQENMQSGSSFVSVGKERPALGRFSISANLFYWRLHGLMLLIFLIFVGKWLFAKDWGTLIPALALALPVCVVFFSSPLSFWQGDRLVVTALPLWAILYAALVAKALERLDRLIMRLPVNLHSIFRLTR